MGTRTRGDFLSAPGAVRHSLEAGGKLPLLLDVVRAAALVQAADAAVGAPVSGWPHTKGLQMVFKTSGTRWAAPA